MDVPRHQEGWTGHRSCDELHLRHDGEQQPSPLYSGVVSVKQEGPAAGARTPVVPWQLRVAGAIVGLEAVAALVLTAALALRAASSGTSLGLVLGQAGFFLVVAVTLGAVAAGLVRGRHWSRAPAIVTQLLLLPVAYSLIGPSHQLVLGIVTGGLVAGCFLLLISSAAREWAAAEWR